MLEAACTPGPMSTFTLEFGFLPAELVFKSHEFVRAYHDTHGSHRKFVMESHFRAAKGGYLKNLERLTVKQGKLLRVAIVFALASILLALTINGWFIIVTVVGVVAALRIDRNIKFNLIQERGLILSIEILATDFAGWGTLFPAAQSKAVDWLGSAAFGSEGYLLDTYMPTALKATLVDDFRPSEGSVCQASQMSG
jgi:hypothetical protein